MCRSTRTRSIDRLLILHGTAVFPPCGAISAEPRLGYHCMIGPSTFLYSFATSNRRISMQKTRFGMICASAALVLAIGSPAAAQQPGAPGGGQGRGQGRGFGGGRGFG